ncbi:hypothetical protein A3F00_02790 [Candidatus Daviesbacteria bacterium RIFCSPHIGHO2_12_FULL_37_11]|uniref:Phosphatidic acid phosphatase type 2/haloperoxidase domain-containing protein n=1 Tax=Candidatus Daviesbacteria bacterium RIFCSPHIGHO2_12_FULL_37_11 TaxID=1797777 RepID=A0A1F5K991_9BACT|nr:MAG: hypothetical protein A2769_01905 [Candidatus Daviesbacteria bacterium RIFCSPHIGHO2_01_FULL_37_27]OGE37378.1 MAG: hypothetical protein A3F00_02790 [Candidatus Daviesbacteria bacterium RIFCSPHIGHO2_12_FULL_37_11]OGE45544.1 MAG: hypothetical protein A3B39_05025 [Candidatus Daviesbacteria bacterium RIFCSPLOWO2_01_FULL_37_10]
MDYLSSINEGLFFKIFNLSGQNKILDLFMVTGANYVIFGIFFLCLAAFFFGSIKDKKAFLLTILSLFLGFILLKTIGTLIFEPRPFQTFSITPLVTLAPNDSFPSDHTLIASIIAFSYIFYKSKYGVPMGFASIWVGFGRVYSGVHYPFDILGGIIMGFLAVCLAWIIKKKISF